VRPFEFDEIELGAEAANVENGLDLENRDSITKFLRDKASRYSMGLTAGGEFDQASSGQVERDASGGERQGHDAASYPIKGG
jgi:hypothetical protein